jgi:hypothetical protein
MYNNVTGKKPVNTRIKTIIILTTVLSISKYFAKPEHIPKIILSLGNLVNCFAIFPPLKITLRFLVE